MLPAVRLEPNCLWRRRGAAPRGDVLYWDIFTRGGGGGEERGRQVQIGCRVSGSRRQEAAARPSCAARYAQAVYFLREEVRRRELRGGEREEGRGEKTGEEQQIHEPG